MIEDNRSKILNAASQLFLDGGLSALSVRAIAKKAGTSTIGIYSHFDGKQGILDTLYIEGFELIKEAMLKPIVELDAQAPVLQKIRLATSAYMQVAESYGGHYRLIFGELDDTFQPSEPALQVATEAFTALLNLVSEMFDQNVNSIEIRKAAVSVWSIVHGHVGLSNHDSASGINIGDWKVLATQNVEQYASSVIASQN